MKSTGYVYDSIFLKHEKSGHPESSARLKAVLKELDSQHLFEKMQLIPSRPAELEELELVHSKDYIQRVQEISQREEYIDPDTYTNRFTWQVARMAVGSLINLTEAVIEGEIDNAFALIRPPGHHAEPSQGYGFCVFNNEAIAIQAIRIKYPIKKIAIVDFDVHHGNGTQKIFERDPAVLYISSHLYPFYPGTGDCREIGIQAGTGTIINIPLGARVGDKGLMQIYKKIVGPALLRFKPELIIVCAGYDAHWMEPLASLNMTLTGLGWISKYVYDLARQICEGNILFTLNGGYEKTVLAKGVANSIRILLGEDHLDDPFGNSTYEEPDIEKSGLINQIKKAHDLFSSPLK